MNFSIVTRNRRIVRLLFWVCLIVLSACVSNPTVPPKGIAGVVSDTGTAGQSPYPTMSMVQSPHGSEILSSYSGSYALLIGESQYTNGWSKLTAIPRELQQVEALLTAKGFQVERAMDMKADALESRFKKFIKQYGFDKNNRLLFFYSGHGHTRHDKGYLVPTDAPNPNFDEKGFLQKALGMNQILTWAREIEAKHALFLFDSCFSGMVFKAKALPDMPRQISEMAKLPVRQFITAGSADEPVPAKSVFTPAFIDALRYGLGDLYKDGYVTGEELGLYLKNKVPEHTDQTPQYGKIKDYELARGDFVFVVGAGQPTQPVQPKVSYPYIDNGDGTVTDNRSGLVWLKNANCFGRQKWKKAMRSAANLASGQCGLSDGSRRGMWRLPTKDELKAMIDKRYKEPTLSNAAGTGKWREGDAFSGVLSGAYWSSTTYANDTSFAWRVTFHDGSVYYFNSTNTMYVWPVRGGQ